MRYDTCDLCGKDGAFPEPCDNNGEPGYRCKKCGGWFLAENPLHEQVENMKIEIELLKGAMRADDMRLRNAELTVYGDPDKTFGCDAAEHLAEIIVDLRRRLKKAEERLAS